MRKTFVKYTLWVFFCLFMPLSVCYADIIQLKSGKSVEGKIMAINDSYVKLEISGVVVTYFQDEIASISELPAASKSQAAQIKNDFSKDPDDLILLGMDLLIARRNEEARAALNEALRIDPHNPDAMHAMGCFSAITGANEETAQFFKKVLDARPHRTELYLALYEIYMNLQQEKEAEVYLKKLLDLQKNSKDEFVPSAIRQFHLYLKMKKLSVP